MNKYETARDLARRALEALKPSDSSPAYASTMLEWIRANAPDEVARVEKSWASFLTQMQDDPDSVVVRDPGKYGFRLREVSAAQPVLVESADELSATGTPASNLPSATLDVARRSRVERERQLYSLLVSWLSGKQYKASDCSTAKRGGSWGNPDVVGVHCFEGYGSAMHLELASIEAKLTLQNWRKDFFEAVAHKRFADRAYFAFSFGATTPDLSAIADLQQFRQYGEKYRVGVLVVFLEPSIHEALCNSQTEVDLADANYSVEEIWPAIHDAVPPQTRETFMRDVLELQTIRDVMEFGD